MQDIARYPKSYLEKDIQDIVYKHIYGFILQITQAMRNKVNTKQ